MSLKKRVNVSTTQKTTETLGVNGWSLTFNHEKTGDAKPQSVQVHGVKADDQNASVFGSKTNSQTNINFNNVPFDAELAGVIAKELDDIMA